MSRNMGLLCVALAVIALPVIPAAAHVPSTAEKYCTALSDEYVKYEVSPTMISKNFDLVGDVAVAQCKEHQPGPAIPVLKNELVHFKLPLPAYPPGQRLERQ